MPSNNELITIQQAASMLGTQPQQLYQAIAKGKLPVYMQSNVKHVKRDEVRHWYVTRPGVGGTRSGQLTGWHANASASYSNSLEGLMQQQFANLPKITFDPGEKVLGSFSQKRSWGVEIEVVGPIVTGNNADEITAAREKNNRARQRMVTRVAETGLPVRVGAKKSDSSMTHWLVQYDSSCGMELVSPPMRGTRGLVHLSTAMKHVAHDYKVNKECGYHVHIDIRDFSVDQLRALYTLYYAFEEAIDQFMPESRRGRSNKQCKSMRLPYFSQIVKASNHAQIVKLFSQHDDVKDDRKFKLNGLSFATRGTIEFRHHGGTTDARKAIMWVRFCMSMVDTAAHLGRSVPGRADMEGMIEFLQLDDDVASFYRDRVRDLARAQRKEDADRRNALRSLERDVATWASLFVENEKGTLKMLKEGFLELGYFDVQADAMVDAYVRTTLLPYVRVDMRREA